MFGLATRAADEAELAVPAITGSMYVSPGSTAVADMPISLAFIVARRPLTDHLNTPRRAAGVLATSPHRSMVAWVPASTLTATLPLAASFNTTAHSAILMQLLEVTTCATETRSRFSGARFVTWKKTCPAPASLSCTTTLAID